MRRVEIRKEYPDMAEHLVPVFGEWAIWVCYREDREMYDKVRLRGLDYPSERVGEKVWVKWLQVETSGKSMPAIRWSTFALIGVDVAEWIQDPTAWTLGEWF